NLNLHCSLTCINSIIQMIAGLSRNLRTNFGVPVAPTIDDNTGMKFQFTVSRLLLIIFATAIVFGCLVAWTREPKPNAEALPGSYYRGDGTGYNVTLTLQAKGKYTALWQ